MVMILYLIPIKKRICETFQTQIYEYGYGYIWQKHKHKQ